MATSWSESQSVEIETDVHKTYKAKVVGTDPKTDVALLKVDGRSDFPICRVRRCCPAGRRLGARRRQSIRPRRHRTAGIVSARGRDIGTSPFDDFIQIDAPVNKGNSGGPAFDESGKVVGSYDGDLFALGGFVGSDLRSPADTVKFRGRSTKGKPVPSPADGSEFRSSRSLTISPTFGPPEAEGALVDELQPMVQPSRRASSPATGSSSINRRGGQGRARPSQEDSPGIAPGQNPLGVFSDGSERTVALTVAKMPDRTATDAGRAESTMAAPLRWAETCAGRGNRRRRHAGS